jgi:hypothetical protein
VRPSGFFFASWIQKITSRAYSCAYTRPCTTDPEVLPSWFLWPRHSTSYCDDAAWESNFCREPCLVVSIPKIFTLLSLTSRKSLPMGVN